MTTEPIALVKLGGSEVVAFACGECGTVVGSVKLNGSVEAAFKAAKVHCACPLCDGKMDGTKTAICETCTRDHRAADQAKHAQLEVKRFAKAKRVSDATVSGETWIYDPTESYGNDGYAHLEDFIEEVMEQDLDEVERPKYVWLCTSDTPSIEPVHFVERMVEDACEEAHEDAYDQLVGVPELLETLTPILEAWNRKQTTRTWQVDYETAVLLDSLKDVKSDD